MEILVLVPGRPVNHSQALGWFPGSVFHICKIGPGPAVRREMLGECHQVTEAQVKVTSQQRSLTVHLLCARLSARHLLSSQQRANLLLLASCHRWKN